MRLVDNLEQDDVLIVTKLDRLGRNAMDVATTVDRLAKAGVCVHCLALGGVDLTSPAGRMTMGVIGAAQFERDLLIDRTQSGLKRPKAEGAVLRRPATLDTDQRDPDENTATNRWLLEARLRFGGLDEAGGSPL